MFIAMFAVNVVLCCSRWAEKRNYLILAISRDCAMYSSDFLAKAEILASPRLTQTKGLAPGELLLPHPPV